MKYGDEWFDGNFEPIISPPLFEAVQKVLQERERPRKRKARHDFPFTGLFKCAECDSMISAQWTTNRHGTKYRYYRCSKKRGRCSQSYLQEQDLVAQLKGQLQTISLCDRYTDWMLEKVKEWEQEENSTSQSEVHQLQTESNAAEKRMDKLISTYLDGDVPREIYLKKKDEIMRLQVALQEKAEAVAHGRNNWVEPLREWILDTKQAAFLSDSENYPKIKQFIQKIGTNPTVRDKSAHFGVSSPYQFVAQRQRILRSASRSARSRSDLTKQEVKICGPLGLSTPHRRHHKGVLRVNP